MQKLNEVMDSVVSKFEALTPKMKKTVVCVFFGLLIFFFIT